MIQIIRINKLLYITITACFQPKMRDWNHFFGSLRKYLDYLRTCAVVPSVQGFVPGPQTISENELYGLLSWARLATEIARNVGPLCKSSI